MKEENRKLIELLKELKSLTWFKQYVDSFTIRYNSGITFTNFTSLTE